ncbi:MAG: hypothetical protein JEZ00_16330 [Anaerolineaceae bacterium]|nr:hypothetical protein [Anaerolineaceae bacterium]
MSKFIKYFLLGTLFWVIVDYTTVFNPDFPRWVAHMPLVWVFYLGYPLLFAWLIYKQNFAGKKLFFSMIIATVFCELIAFQNTLLYTFPIMLIMIPLAVCIYTLITYVPMWLVNGKLKQHWRLSLFLTIVWLLIAFLNYKTNIAG